MRISTALRIVGAAGIVVSVATLSLVYLMNRSIESERMAIQRQLEFRQLGHDLEQASNLLTREARRYTIFGDKRHFDAFWLEVNETRTRDRVVQRLRQLDAPDGELALIETAKQNSDALIATEKRAMDAVQDGDLPAARTLMFDANYDHHKRLIMDPLAEFQQMMNSRAEAEAHAARDKASRFRNLANGAILAYVVLVVGGLFFLVQRQLVTPLVAISNSIKRIADGDLRTNIPGREFQNEIGELAEAAECFKAALSENTLLTQELQEHKLNLERKVESRTAQLRESEAQMKLTFESSPNGMVVVDSEGLILMVNSEMEKTFGYAREEILGEPIEILLPSELHSEHVELRTEFMKDPRPHRREEGVDLYGMHKDGRMIPVDIGLNPLLFNSETCILAAVVDISARKEAQDMMKTANETLQRSNQELEQVAFVASHDLQEPLRKMSSYAHLLLEECGDDLNDDGREYLGIIVDGASRLKQLVQDLLSFSRINSRGKALIPTNAQECFDVAVSHLELSLIESQANVTSEALPTVHADASQLTMLFQNLISNAVKYCERDPRIHVGCRDLGDEVEFCVRDNGIGIEAQYYDRVFEIFKRLHPRQEYSGTGIGLANCKRIVERFGGRLWVESTPGEGSEFYFTLSKDTEEGTEPCHPMPTLHGQSTSF